MGSNIQTTDISNADLRGGPSMKYPGSTNLWYWVGTDSRKKFRFMFNNRFNWGRENYTKSVTYWMRFQYRPVNELGIALSPSISYNRNDLQYVATKSFVEDPRYLTAQINQTTYRMEIRINYNINPNLTITYWGQPFVTKGDYVDYKRITDSKADSYSNRFHTFTDDEISFNEVDNLYYIDENKDGTTDYEIYNPNFNFLQFRSNAVLRWEYKPGSALFLVWIQNRSENLPFAAVDNSLGGITKDLFSITPENIFLIKYTYRFIL